MEKFDGLHDNNVSHRNITSIPVWSIRHHKSQSNVHTSQKI